MNRTVPFTKGAAIGVQRLGDWIYFCRIKRGISQRALGFEIDVERKTICAWENGLRVPPFDAVCRMMEVFGVDKYTIDIAELGEYSDSLSANDRKSEEMKLNNTKQ